MTVSIRRAAEVLLGSLRVRRQLPKTSGGGFVVATARVGGLKYLFKRADQLDPELLRMAGLLVDKGDVVWDIGTNVGLFSVAAAARAGSKGRVVSVEADIDAVTLLNAATRLRLSEHAEMTVLPVAVGANNGFVKFSIAKRARAANAIQGYGSTQMGGVLEVRVLPCITLDTLLDHFPGPQVLKIDVEGAEQEVLGGAARLLAEVRPLIYCEVASNTQGAVTSILRKHRYRLWDGATFDGRFIDELTVASNNTVAIPEEKTGIY
jgi:FkbM family methyltransferase